MIEAEVSTKKKKKKESTSAVWTLLITLQLILSDHIGCAGNGRKFKGTYMDIFLRGEFPDRNEREQRWRPRVTVPD